MEKMKQTKQCECCNGQEENGCSCGHGGCECGCGHDKDKEKVIKKNKELISRRVK